MRKEGGGGIAQKTRHHAFKIHPRKENMPTKWPFLTYLKKKKKRWQLVSLFELKAGLGRGWKIRNEGNRRDSMMKQTPVTRPSRDGMLLWPHALLRKQLSKSPLPTFMVLGPRNIGISIFLRLELQSEDPTQIICLLATEPNRTQYPKCQPWGQHPQEKEGPSFVPIGSGISM